MDKQQKQEIEAMAEDIFELTTMSWRARARGRQKNRFDLSESEFLTLDLLTQSSPMTVGQLQRKIGVLPAQMSRVIRSLETKSGEPLIECAINLQDKRKIDVTPTKAGRRHHEGYKLARLGTTIETLAELSEYDRGEFMRILRSIKARYAKHLNSK